MNHRKPRRQQIATAAALVLAVWIVGCQPKEQDRPSVSPDQIDSALSLIEQGRYADAERILASVQAADPGGPIGDRAALVLGNLLIEQRRHAEALALLRRAGEGVVGVEYARLLLVRATVEGELQQAFEEAEARARELADPAGPSRPLVREEATYLLTKLAERRDDAAEAARWGERLLTSWPRSAHLHEVRKITADALSEIGRNREAFELYQTIWLETPESPWGEDAREALASLGSRFDFVRRQLSPTEQYEFIEALRASGRHRDALEQVESLLRAYPGHPRIDGVLYMRAMSQHALRQNDECVATVDALSSGYPSSPYVPDATIYAIRALRRGNNTREIRRWTDFVTHRYPTDGKAFEARFQLGVYLGNVVDKQEGQVVLERLIRDAGRGAPILGDALWKVAWLQRNQGRTSEARATLDRLLRELPESKYRKAALYWVAKWSEEVDRDRAIELYRDAVREFANDYYGHESRKNLVDLGVRVSRVGSNRQFPAIDRLDDPGARPGAGYVQAANLKSIGLYKFAAQELEAVPGVENDASLQFTLAELYARSGSTWEAMKIIREQFQEFMQAGSRDPQVVPIEFWHVVFPFHHRAEIEKAVREVGLPTSVDPYLVAALIRSESFFKTNAVSPVGAIGLMQLMPDTAREIATERGLSQPSRSDLFHPAKNIRFGTYYLARLVREFQGEWFPAVCSYNAGSGPVRRWWQARPSGQPLDEFIENIPFDATRAYIKKVLGDYKNYEWIYPEVS